MVRLGDVCTVVSGTTPKSTQPEYWDGDLNWVTPAELTDESDVIYESQRKITSQAVADSSLKSFPAGTVLLSSRAPIGKVAIAGTEMYCNQGFKNLICSDKIYNRYLYHFLKNNTDYLNSLGRGATFKEISKGIVENIEIPLPSLDEQRKIAAVLDKVSDLIAKRRQQLTKLDELVKARFVEIFGDPVSNPYQWEKVTLSDLADVRIGPFGSLLHKEDYIVGGYPLVNPSHIWNDKIVVDENFSVSKRKYTELEPYHLKIGDVVMGRRGEMGRCAVVQREGLLCGTGSLIIRPKGDVTADYIQKIISFPSFKKTIEDMAVGQTMPNLNVPIVSNFQIIKPPLQIQEKYFELVEKTGKTKTIISHSLEQLEMLKKVLMQKYFG